MEHSSLSSLIDTLEKGTKVHICLAFMNDAGNRKTRLTESQTIHNQPICLEMKKRPKGLENCYRCRMTVQKAVVKHRNPMAGFCTSGVYEYCRPVVYDDKVICVIFIGNILIDDPEQREKLGKKVGSRLLKTMDCTFTPEDCVKTADVLESYIQFLFDRYGTDNKTFDPLVENMKSYIRENAAYDFTMEEMAAMFNYSTKYLGRIFKVRTGETIGQYCNRLKIDRAKELLTETNLSIETVAVQVGFNSNTYFDRVFHKISGLSPQAYRKTLGRK